MGRKVLEGIGRLDFSTSDKSREKKRECGKVDHPRISFGMLIDRKCTPLTFHSAFKLWEEDERAIHG